MTSERTPIYAWVVLIVLTLVYSISWVARFSLIILIEPISREIELSDTEMGLLTGFGFAVVYSIAGFPIARWADRGSRRGIIAGSLAVFSGITMLMGLARNFAQLLLARAGVAASEAGISPAAYSLIAEYFAPKRRATAIAIYSLGTAAGQWVGLSAGGYLSGSVGWRNAMFILGAPGLVLAALFIFAVREPKRSKASEVTWSVPEAMRILTGGPAFLALAIGLGLSSFASNGFGMWAPTYLMRVLHFTAADVGRASGLLQGVSGMLGSIGGAILADKLSARDGRWYIWIAMLGTAAILAAEWVFFFGSMNAMFGAYFAIQVLAAVVTIPIFTVAQSMVPGGMRAFGTSVLLFALNVIGVGAGPFVAGLLSDLMKASSSNSLRDGILLLQVGGVVGILSLHLAARHFHRHIARINSIEARQLAAAESVIDPAAPLERPGQA